MKGVSSVVPGEVYRGKLFGWKLFRRGVVLSHWKWFRSHFCVFSLKRIPPPLGHQRYLVGGAETDFEIDTGAKSDFVCSHLR